MDDELYEALLKANQSAVLAEDARRAASELNELILQIRGGSDDAVAAAREVTRRLSLLGRNDPNAAHERLNSREILEAAVAAAGVEHAAETMIVVEEGTAAIGGRRDELVQAFRALIRNAAEAMSPPPERPRIQLSARNLLNENGTVNSLEPGVYVEFEVRDNGTGIAAENLERIWEPLFTTKRHGAGLGLPTALAIFRKHGGQMGVDSDVGVGTVMTVYLPIATEPIAATGGEATPATRYRTGRLLVMDDNEKTRAVTAGLLQRLDYTCDLARDAEEALTWYRRYWDIGRPYDAVLLDLQLPGGIGGEAALARIRSLDPEVRSLALAPLPAESLAETARLAGFTGWLTKPFKLSELGEALQIAIGR
ncbi:MAG TPA: ATP-binding protein [Opitutaceae bacterium]|jgi:CheY-like chemotaxis protein